MTTSSATLRDALGTVQDAFTGATGVLVGLVLTTAPGGILWRTPPGDAARRLPVVIVQPQESGRPEPYVGHIGWSGLVVFKAQAHTDAAARACLAAVEAAIPRAFDFGSTRITCVMDRPVLLPIPVGSSVVQAGVQYRITINPK